MPHTPNPDTHCETCGEVLSIYHHCWHCHWPPMDPAQDAAQDAAPAPAVMWAVIPSGASQPHRYELPPTGSSQVNDNRLKPVASKNAL